MERSTDVYIGDNITDAGKALEAIDNQIAYELYPFAQDGYVIRVRRGQQKQLERRLRAAGVNYKILENCS